MNKLRKKFSSLTRARRKHKTDLERLGWYLDETLEKIRKEYADLTDKNGDYKAHGFSINIDGSQFSKRELEPIAAKIEALHDFCREKDICLEIDGFDLLPHGYSVLSFAVAGPYGVHVGVDSRRTYCGYAHPHALKFGSANLEMSKPRPPAAAPAEPPVEAQDVGTSKEIILHTPIRLQKPKV